MKPNRVNGRIDDLVSDVLSTMPLPYAPQIIDDVFLEIERVNAWKTRYDRIHSLTSHAHINRRTGRAVLNQTGFTTVGRSYTPQSTLIGSFSLLAAA